MAAGMRRSSSRTGADHGSAHGPAHGHGHSHGHGPVEPASPRLRNLVTALLLPLAAVAVFGVILLWPAAPHPPSSDRVWVQGTITASQLGPAGPSGGVGTPGQPGQQAVQNQLTIRITSGPTKGATITQTVGVDAVTPKYAAGDGVVLTYAAKAPAESQYEIKDFQRGPPLMSLAIAFALFVLAVGRWRGAGAILALGVSFFVLVKFTLPAIVAGENAVEVAAVTAGVILFVALYATHGISVRTSVAVLGTGLSLVLIGALGELWTKLGHLTGLGDDNAVTVAALFHHVDVRGLLLAGVIIGALGVLNDVTATQVSSVWELKAADPSLTAGELFRAGMRIGRDHIGSTVNTLVLAYAGGSLPLFVLMSTSGQAGSGSATVETVAEEIVRTLVGSIGLAAAVPITTALAAFFAAGEDLSPELEYEDLYAERTAPRSPRHLDDTIAGARLGGGAARTSDSRRSGEWRTDGTRVEPGRGPRRVPRPAPPPQPAPDPYAQNPYEPDPYGADPYQSAPYQQQPYEEYEQPPYQQQQPPYYQ